MHYDKEEKTEMASGKKKSDSSLMKTIIIVLLIIVELAICGSLVTLLMKSRDKSAPVNGATQVAEGGDSAREAGEKRIIVPLNLEVIPTATPVPIIQLPELHAHAVDSTEPSNYISFTGIQKDGIELDSVSDYSSESNIQFGAGENYTTVDGIVTFRGNNFRNNPVYGNADLKEKQFGDHWEIMTGSLVSGSNSWSGSGWTGQPLMERWPREVKQHMNMYDWAKEKDDLVEVIYACMDGNVYFIDLETGEQTRDKLYLGFTFKGAGALDPRGYPIMYLGAGINSDTYGTARVFVINLLDCSTMYTFGNDDEFSYRGGLSFFDSSALVDAETDTLIYPGENGILYLMKLNTEYDLEAGTLSIAPSDITKWHYYGNRSSDYSYWLGMEDSAVIYGGYLYIADNGANFMCIDLNTLQLVWAQDILDDSNSTPVLSMENDHPYLYVSTSFHLGWRSSDGADVPIWKIDAETGEIIWKTSYYCYSMDGVSGGVQSTIAVGQNAFADNIYVTVSRTPSFSSGVIACIDKATGEVKWENQSQYAWSSPACVYDREGNGVVIYCDSEGYVHMLDGLTGDEYDRIQLNGNVEASPAIYGNRLVVGTRECKIYGIELR